MHLSAPKVADYVSFKYYCSIDYEYSGYINILLFKTFFLKVYILYILYFSIIIYTLSLRAGRNGTHSRSSCPAVDCDSLHHVHRQLIIRSSTGHGSF